MKILQTSPGAAYWENKVAIDLAVSRALDSGWYILGKEVSAFEKSFADWLKIQYCIGVANGTDADELLLRAIGIGAGDKVATVANTAVATVAAIERTGAAVRFADIDPDTFTLSPRSLAELLEKEPGIKAVIAVHLFGHPADMDGLTAVAQKYGVKIVEDCAQAHGAQMNGKYCGTMGCGGAFSFYPTKNLGAFGDGGAIVTSDSGIAEKLTALRQYGWTKRYISEYSGVNSRLDELQAAILSIKLPHLAQANDRRRVIAARYSVGLQGIAGLILPQERANCRHVYHQYVVRVLGGRRDALQKYLAENGIGTAVHYPMPIHRQPAYTSVPRTVSLTATEEVNPQLLSLPMFPELKPEEVDFVIQAIAGFFR